MPKPDGVVWKKETEGFKNEKNGFGRRKNYFKAAMRTRRLMGRGVGDETKLLKKNGICSEMINQYVSVQAA